MYAISIIKAIILFDTEETFIIFSSLNFILFKTYVFDILSPSVCLYGGDTHVKKPIPSVSALNILEMFLMNAFPKVTGFSYSSETSMFVICFPSEPLSFVLSSSELYIIYTIIEMIINIHISSFALFLYIFIHSGIVSKSVIYISIMPATSLFINPAYF